MFIYTLHFCLFALEVDDQFMLYANIPSVFFSVSYNIFTYFKTKDRNLFTKFWVVIFIGTIFEMIVIPSLSDENRKSFLAFVFSSSAVIFYTISTEKFVLLFLISRVHKIVGCYLLNT